MDEVRIRTIVDRKSGEGKLIAMISEASESEDYISDSDFKDEDFFTEEVFRPIGSERFSIIFNNLMKAKAEFVSAFCRRCARESFSREKPLNCTNCQARLGNLDVPPIDGIAISKVFEGKSKNKKLLFFYRAENKKDSQRN